MVAEDRDQFKAAMVEEIRAHEKNRHWRVVPRDQAPPGHKMLPAVWALKWKRRIQTQKVYKRKTRINLGGQKQEKGINYWETYAPVVSWTTIRLFLLISIVRQWETRQEDRGQALG